MELESKKIGTSKITDILNRIRNTGDGGLLLPQVKYQGTLINLGTPMKFFVLDNKEIVLLQDDVMKLLGCLCNTKYSLESFIRDNDLGESGCSFKATENQCSFTDPSDGSVKIGIDLRLFSNIIHAIDRATMYTLFRAIIISQGKESAR